MKNITLKYLFGLIIIASSFNSTAQIIATPPTPAQQQDRLKKEKMIKEAAAKKAAADKILNATLISIKLNVFSDNPGHGFFKDKFFSMKGLGNNPFKTPSKYVLDSKGKNYTNQNRVSSWLFNTSQGEADKDGFGGITTASYQSFLQNGFNINITFTGRVDRILESECAASFSVDFRFSDGTVITVPLQGITIAGAKGAFKVGRLRPFIINKNMPGSEFPDPNNPVVIVAPK